MDHYDHRKIEKKWQARWKKNRIYRTKENYHNEKFYVLDMFPYPSGEGLHVGHPKGYIATDVLSRLKRMQGFEVLHPMGFDAFGLPAENYALKTKTNPEIAVKKNIARYKKQLELLGFDYDWSREIQTTDPAYYKWTQWIFLQLFKKGLAYESNEPINWCPVDKTGLANEDIENGRCERCGALVEKRPMRQWVLRITDYAEKLLSGLEKLDWPESIKELQRNWIGKSEGSEIEFELKALSPKPQASVRVFTTRADTLFGATYLVLAPEHPILENNELGITNYDEVLRYIVTTKEKTEVDRTAEGKEKTGVELKGVKAINPANNEEIPIFVADYVLAHYGTGAIMAVPAHDERDFEFAKKYKLASRAVVLPTYVGSGTQSWMSQNKISDENNILEVVRKSVEERHSPYINRGSLLNSGKFNGLTSDEAMKRISEFVAGKMVITYKLRDWVFSRQRYWGEPIPLIHCEHCGVVAVPENDLPVKLPKVEHYEPTGTGESPLASISKWVNVKCPHCGGKGKRETNTMPQWAGSSWYYLRYTDPKNKKEFASRKKMDYWLRDGLPLQNSAQQNTGGVDFYVGGAEHATRHLIYARFWHRFLFDNGLVSQPEPFKKLQHVGLIMGADGRKMSKRWGNVINPDDVVERLGADSLRVYEIFMGPFDQAIAWNTDNLVGARRFLERVWRLQFKVGRKEKITLTTYNLQLTTLLHKTIKKVTEDITAFKFNTAISQLMILTGALEREETIPVSSFRTLTLLLAPFAPHTAEELWEILGEEGSVHTVEWPSHDEAMISSASVSVAVQVNGKIRARMIISPDLDENMALQQALSLPEVTKWLGKEQPRKVVYVKGKIISIVT